MTTNKKPVERIFIDDTRVKPQTIRHHVNRYEFAIQLQKPYRDAVDLGCGTGYGADMLKKAGYENVYGFDISPIAINHAKRHFPGIYFETRSLGELVIPAAAGIITMFEVIEHLSFREGVHLLEKINNAMLRSGIFVLSTPRDINNKYNNFHKSEWSYDTIKNYVGSYFNVEMYGQDWDTGIISPDHVKENDFYIAVCKK